MSLREFLRPVRIVLVDTALPENIGSAARAMKTMGLSDLALVRPKLFPDQRANALAAGADDLLEQARVAASLADAIADCVHAVGCTARLRDISLPMFEPSEASAELLRRMADGPVALVFGAERTGLTNEDLSRCDAAVHIPTEADFSSLNLAQAVQVLAYCVRGAALSAQALPTVPGERRDDPPATIEQMERMFGHFEEALTDIDFFKGRPYGHLMQRIRRMLHRADLDSREVMILRGILAEAQRMARLAQGAVNK
jgi:tRNA (cytidine32/uridine32-2'-O)-methyltransferase